MNYEIILLTAFDNLTGKVYGVYAEDTYKQPSTYQGKKVWLIYKDTGRTKIVNNKPRRIFDLEKIENGQTT